MAPTFVHYIPIATTIVSLAFAGVLCRRFMENRTKLYLLWWGMGALLYGAGTFLESWVTLFGWHPIAFRGWYIAGALLGGAPLAQGTVYLLLPKRKAHILSAVLIVWVATAAMCVVLTPLNYSLVEPHRLSGQVIEWTWVRLFSPFINTYAFIFLVGGAVLSAWRYSKNRESHYRFVGNVFIAIGAVLPGVGGSFTRAGYTEVLYVTEFVGIVLLYIGYVYNRKPFPPLTNTKTTAITK